MPKVWLTWRVCWHWDFRCVKSVGLRLFTLLCAEAFAQWIQQWSRTSWLTSSHLSLTAFFLGCNLSAWLRLMQAIDSLTEGGQAHVYFKCMGKYKWHEMTCFFLQSESFGHCSEGLEILNWMVIDRISCRHIIMFCLCQQKSLVKRVNRVSPEDIQLKNEAAEQVRLLFFIGFWSVLKTIIYMNIQEAIAVSNLHTNFFRMDIIEDWTLLSVRWSAWSQTICKKFEGPGYDYFNFQEIVKKPSTLVIEWYQV